MFSIFYQHDKYRLCSFLLDKNVKGSLLLSLRVAALHLAKKAADMFVSDQVIQWNPALSSWLQFPHTCACIQTFYHNIFLFTHFHTVIVDGNFLVLLQRLYVLNLKFPWQKRFSVAQLMPSGRIFRSMFPLHRARVFEGKWVTGSMRGNDCLSHPPWDQTIQASLFLSQKLNDKCPYLQMMPTVALRCSRQEGKPSVLSSFATNVQWKEVFCSYMILPRLVSQSQL